MAGDDTIAYASAAALAELYRKRDLSPVEAAKLLFARIDASAAQAQRVLHRRSRRRACRGERFRGALAPWCAAVVRLDGVPVDDQGPDADARVPDPARLAS